MSVDKGSQRLIDQAKRAPRLSPEAELACIRAWQRTRDRRAAQRLIEANLRHVVFTALKYKNYGIPIADLISEGNVGLMKALDRFDPERNVRFATYAAYWVRAQIVMGVMDSWSLMSGPRGALDSRVFFRLRRERARLGAEPPASDGTTTEQRLAERFGVSEERMNEMLAQLDSRGLSLDAPATGHERWIDQLTRDAEQSNAIEQREQSAQLERILGRVRGELDPRETFILDRRLMADPEEKLSLGEIGQHFGVSRERVRQIEVRAQRKLKNQALQEELGIDTCAA
ncbi:MAG TPA: RNA polymerase sigma factor RpoD/SigA [Polyangiaceae bacterium]|nr:RNA polymerase sigma factor RpoD/SigA [Polyangiaceae bacterium]